MNKNVLDYLNDKTQNVADYIRAKSESAGNYITSHAKNIKKGAIRATATALTAATLLTGLSACDANEILVEPDIEQETTTGELTTEMDTFVETEVTTEEPTTDSNQQEQETTENKPALPEMRPIEEIEKTGITADDVLAAMDNLAWKIFNVGYKDSTLLNPDDINNVTCSFFSLEPTITTPASEELMPYKDPFYHLLDNYTPNFEWLNNKNLLNDVYATELYIKLSINGKNSLISVLDLGIAKEDFENVMNALDMDQFTITTDYLESLSSEDLQQYSHLIGNQAYSGLEIDRDLVVNATEEQLWALYNATMNSMTSINLEGTLNR